MHREGLALAFDRVGEKKGPTVLAAGIIDGLSSLFKLWGAGRSLRHRRYAPHGIKSDWLSVGEDLRGALSTWKVDEIP